MAAPCEQGKDCVVYAVKMSLGARAGCRIALRLVQNAELLLRRERDGEKGSAARNKGVATLLGDGARDCLGGQIEDFFRQMPAHRENGGIERGDGLADAGRRFDEETTALGDCPVHAGDELLLPGAVRERKRQVRNGGIPGLAVVLLPFCEAAVLAAQREKPFGEFVEGKCLIEESDGFGIQMNIGHTDGNCGKPFPERFHVSVTAGLRKMRRDRRGERVYIAEHTFDFVDGVPVLRILVDAVCPTFNRKRKIAPLVVYNLLVLKRHFGAVSRGLSLLNPAVHSSTFRHRLGIASNRPVVEISAPCHKLHEIAHGNANANRFDCGVERIHFPNDTSAKQSKNKGMTDVRLRACRRECVNRNYTTEPPELK